MIDYFDDAVPVCPVQRCRRTEKAEKGACSNIRGKSNQTRGLLFVLTSRSEAIWNTGRSPCTLYCTVGDGFWSAKKFSRVQIPACLEIEASTRFFSADRSVKTGFFALILESEEEDRDFCFALWQSGFVSRTQPHFLRINVLSHIQVAL